MTQVGAAEGAAGVAPAFLVRGARIASVAGRLDLQPSLPGEEEPVARHPGGQDAVEKIDSGERAAQEVLGRSDAHQVPRLVRRKERRRVLDPFPHLRGVLAYRETAERGARQIERGDLLDVAFTQIAEEPSLDDSEERGASFAAVPLRLAAHRPSGGARHGFLVPRAVGLGREALVETHEDVAPEEKLDPGCPLRGEDLRAAVEVAAERGALLVNLAVLGERVDLESARVGEDAAVPRHEPVQAAYLRDQLGTGTQQQVIRIAEHDLSTDRR